MPYAVPINAPTSCRIEHKDLREFALELVAYPSELLFPPVRVRSASLAGRNGSTMLGIVYDDWRFVISCALHGVSKNDARTKLDRFKRWIDRTQSYAAEWLVGQKSIKALRFELAGHRYYYTEGTVAVTNGSPTITGTGTFFLSYVKPDVEFVVSGDTTRYIVKSVETDTQITLTENIDRTSDSGLTYQLERRRYLFVNYNGTSSIEGFTPGHFQDYQYGISVGFNCAYPCWVGDEFEITQSSISAGDFLKLRGVGTSAHNPTYHIVGAANSPKIVAADFSYNSRFNGNAKFRDVENLRDRTPETYNYTPQYIPAFYSQGVSFHGLAGISTYLRFYANVDESVPSAVIADRFNARQGMISVMFKPYYNWDSVSGDEHYIFYISANYFLKYDRSSSSFKCRFGHSADITVTVPVFSAGEYLNITAGWDDANNDFKAKIRNMTSADVSQTTSAAVITASNPAQYIFMGNDVSVNKPAKGIIDDFSIYSIYDPDFTADFSVFERHNDRAMDYLNDYLLAHFLLDGSGALVEHDNHGCCRQLTEEASSYTSGTKTFAFTKNANKIFTAGEQVCLWSSGSTNVYYDTVNSVTSTALVVTTGGALTLTGTIYVSRNLLADFNMELANTSYWTASGSALAKEVTIIKQDVRSLKVTDTGAANGYARQTVTTISGRCYKVCGYFYPPSTPDGASYAISCDTDADKSITVTQSNLTGSVWNYVELVFQADDSSATIDFCVGSVTNTEFGYWDGVRMIQMDGAITNAGMEDL